MALSEDHEDQSIQCNNGTTPAHDNQAGDVASGCEGGARNGRHPIPASDRFAGELPEDMDISNLTAQTLVASTGERVTSACGTQELDITSRATVLRQQSSSTLVPQRDVRPDIIFEEDTSSNNTVSSSEAAISETDSQRITDSNDTKVTDSLPLSSAPPLSLGSLNHDVSGSTSLLAGTSAPLQESMQGFGAEVYSNPSKGAEDVLSSADMDSLSKSSEAPLVKNIHEDPKQSIHHFAESSINPKAQRDSSGYKSCDISAESKSKCPHYHQQEAVRFGTCRQNTSTCTSSGLQLSETGIHAIICESGRKRNPFYPRYSELPMRLGSFPEGFRLGNDVLVNRDLLALVGFFYSGYCTVTCFHCGCSPRVWGDGRDPKTEHRMLSPYCRALPSVCD